MRKIILSLILVLLFASQSFAGNFYLGGGGDYTSRSHFLLEQRGNVKGQHFNYFGKAGYLVNNFVGAEVEYLHTSSSVTIDKEVGLLGPANKQTDMNDRFFVNGVVIAPIDFPIKPFGFLGIDTDHGQTQWGAGVQIPLDNWGVSGFYRQIENENNSVGAQVIYYFEDIESGD